ncbi:LysR family transcriptional regulator [Paracoccus sp. (in: a-proteobacteria)]|uniref:LysR family transcriptional regulator n=1 Tax=Paracoccus sp. TaxID=267 RepID=UPI003A8C4751
MAIDLSSRHLRCFLAVAGILNFTRAAQRLNVSQPALSATISQLEGLIGGQLFDRNGRKVFLTPLGEAFAERAGRLLADLDDSVGLLRDQVELRTGRINFACIPSAAHSLLSPVIARFSRSHQNIRIVVQDVLNTAVIDKVQSGVVDFGLAIPMGPMPELDQYELWDDPLVVALPRDHPLTAKAEINWSDLAGEEIIQVSPSSMTRQLADANMPAGSLAGHHFETQIGTTALSLVAEGVGISVLAQLSTAGFAEPDRVVIRRFAGPQICRKICLLRRHGRSLSPAAEAMYGLFRSSF